MPSVIIIFACVSATQVWRLLGPGDAIDRVCVVDLAGKVILEYLLIVSGHEALVLGVRTGEI